VAAIEAGLPQSEIQNAAYLTQLAIESGDQILVGVNDFAIEEPPPEGLLRVDMAVQTEQIARLNTFKATRDNDAAAAAIDHVTRAAQGTDNLMPTFVRAVKAGCTLGEISHALRAVFGVHQERVVV
jgi:methylmalonyl-CoA mutase N-terminal domain/subunit